MRLDLYTVKYNLFPTRSQAADSIKRGFVCVNGSVATKASYEVKTTDTVTSTKVGAYVSRAGEKLEHALQEFNINVTGLEGIDIGSSTGGFTECMLRYGANHIYSIEIGTDQFHQSLRSDPRISLYEQTDFRNFATTTEKVFDIIVCDVSFISLSHIIPHLSKLSHKNTNIVLLFKPQFEVGKQFLNRQGIAQTVAAEKSLDDFLMTLLHHQITCLQKIPSPILGGDGNIEYLLYIKVI